EARRSEVQISAWAEAKRGPLSEASAPDAWVKASPMRPASWGRSFSMVARRSLSYTDWACARRSGAPEPLIIAICAWERRARVFSAEAAGVLVSRAGAA